jgi:hypothetical protein
VRPGEQAGEGVLRERLEFRLQAVVWLRKLGTPNELLADAPADEIGGGDLQRGMDVVGERISPTSAQQVHFGRGVEVAAEAFDVAVRNGFVQSTFTTSDIVG